LVIAFYLLLCLVVGGSAQGFWGNLGLQILGVALLLFAGVSRAGEKPSALSIALAGIALFCLCAIVIQLVPIPANFWRQLPGRSSTADGLDLLGGQVAALPISYTPYLSVMTLFAAIPAIATFVATVRLRPSAKAIAFAVAIGTVLNILLGALQVAGGRNSWAYLYSITNSGAVGFFANQNHTATLLLVSIPFTAALLASRHGRQRSSPARWAVAAAFLVLLLVGIALNGSLAAWALVVPVLLASGTLLPRGYRWRRFMLLVSGLTLAGAVIAVAAAPIATDGFRAEASTSVNSRMRIWGTTMRAIGDSFPAGTGLGSFEQVYRQYEDPSKVTREYVNHAHNDYLELVLELGLAGLVLIVLFLVWWGIAAVKIWASLSSTGYARAATIATAVVMAHSVVDFPLRTASISVTFAALLAIMACGSDGKWSRGTGETARPRHLKLG
jgi:O-antigen ligase